jgi:3-hydroxybutyryl-CoA dehydrogenase
VIGLHFFSPVPVMTLVEVVVALDTSEATVDGGEGVRRAIGKRPIETKDRGLHRQHAAGPVPDGRGADVSRTASPPARTSTPACARRGHPMGPLVLCDFIGLDVLYAVCDSLYDEFKRDEYAPPPLLKRMVASGRLGRKSGRGFYDYP